VSIKWFGKALWRAVAHKELSNFLLVLRRYVAVNVRAHVFFEGLVQGVFFRANTKKCADALGLTGWVKNTYDGRVEAVFEGEENKVHQAIEWCSSKQPHAKVDRRQVDLSEAKGEFDGFSVRY
jgi:acylphosphatase